MQIQSHSKLQHQIVQHLKNARQVSPVILHQLFASQNQQLSVYAHLFNLLYQQSLPTSEQNNHSIQNTSFALGNTLKLRGQILRIYGKFLCDLIYEPAYSLITFDHDKFTNFCSDRGIIDLLHHSKGIYPEIDLTQKVVLQFLPFYNDVEGEAAKLVGNRNWKLAKKILNIYYDQNFKDGIKRNPENMSISMEDTETMNIGIELSFLLLAEKQKELESYVYKVSENIKCQLSQNQAEVLINRLNFWFLNYMKFIEEGINYYEQKQSINQIPVFYGLDSNSFENNIIQLIIKVSQSKYNPDQRQAYLLSLKPLFLDLISQIQSASNRQMRNHTKFLFLAFIQSIIKNIGVQIDQVSSPKKVFTNILSQSLEEQPFYHIFYSDDQILDLYEKGKIRQYPSEFQYGPQATQKILKAYIKNNPEQFIHNLSRINSLPLIEQFKLFVQNSLIGDLNRVDLAEKRSKTPGQTILIELNRNKQKFKDLVVNKAGKQTHLQRLTQFIHQWELIYQFYLKMDINMFRSILDKYAKAIAIKHGHFSNRDELKKDRMLDSFDSQQLTLPYDRPDTAYFLISRFVTFLNKERINYCTMKLDQNANKGISLSKLQIRIKQLFYIFKLEEFKKMVKFAVVPNQDDSEMSKQKFEDFVWKVYAQTALTFDSLLKEVTSKQQQAQIDGLQSQSDQSSVEASQ